MPLQREKLVEEYRGSIVKATDPEGDPTESEPLNDDKSTSGAGELQEETGSAQISLGIPRELDQLC